MFMHIHMQTVFSSIQSMEWVYKAVICHVWLLPVNESCNSISAWLDACVKVERIPSVPLLAKR